MNKELNHIFDVSACPTKKQMHDYLKGAMAQEEIFAFEHHIHSCMLCSEALEGFSTQSQKAISALEELNDTFLKDHLELHPPQIYLNSITHAATIKDKNSNAVWKPLAIAATVLLCLGLGWYFKNHSPMRQSSLLAQSGQKELKSQQAESTSRNIPAENKKSSANSIISSPPEDGGQHTSISKTTAGKSMPSAPAILPQDKSSETSHHAVPPTELPGQEPPQKGEKLALTSQSEDTEGMLPATSPPAASAPADKNDEKMVYDTKSKKAINLNADAVTADNDNNPADNYYKEGNYEKALTEYKKQIKNRDARQSQYAQLMSAHCYLQLGEEKKAKAILEELSSNGENSFRRKARRLLRQIEPK